MKYEAIGLAQQFVGCHPALIDALRDFEAWSRTQGMPEPLLTELWRTPRQQGDIYTSVWRKLLSRYHAHEPLTEKDAELAPLLDKLTEDQLRERAETKFTWHMSRCAADVRVKEYTKQQAAKACSWFQKRCPVPIWEVITETHGTGPHIHVAIRSFEWRRKFCTPEVA